MLEKTISYTDFDGESRTEKHYFHLSKEELVEWETSVEGGMGKMLNFIAENKEVSKIYPMFKEVIKRSYGVKSLDGRRFRKVKEDGTLYFTEFSETEAFSVLMMELLGDAGGAAAFITGIMPGDLAEKVQTEYGQRPKPQDHRPKEVG